MMKKAKLIPILLALLLLTGCKETYTAEYKRGYQAGYDDGYRDCESFDIDDELYDDYERGKKEGYEQGLNDTYVHFSHTYYEGVSGASENIQFAIEYLQGSKEYTKDEIIEMLQLIMPGVEAIEIELSNNY